MKEGEEAKPGLHADAQSLDAAAVRGAAAEHAVVKRAAELTGARDDLLVKIATCATSLFTAASVMCCPAPGRVSPWACSP